MNERFRYVIGIDEVGRGPLAGPVTVAGYRTTTNRAAKFAKQKDSKALSARRREEIAHALRREKNADFAISSVSAKTIDRIGISAAIRRAIGRVMSKLAPSPDNTLVLLDGGLTVDQRFSQQTIIKGDTKVPVIAYASILAKVHRDTYMHRLAKKYPHYGFDTHVGYGTKKHVRAIKKYGPSDMHRKSFLRNICD
jgi:ribonuclease HII